MNEAPPNFDFQDQKAGWTERYYDRKNEGGMNCLDQFLIPRRTSVINTILYFSGWNSNQTTFMHQFYL